jgi:hypothetical protein
MYDAGLQHGEPVTARALSLGEPVSYLQGEDDT